MQRKIITTTLGELIVAVTDEVKSIIRDPSDLYGMVSCILSDLLTSACAFPSGPEENTQELFR